MTGGAPAHLLSASDQSRSRAGAHGQWLTYPTIHSIPPAGLLELPGNTPGVYVEAHHEAPRSGSNAADADLAVITYRVTQSGLYAIGANRSEHHQRISHDVTVGNNAFNGPGFDAGTGYDIPTGLGTPNVANFINDLK